MKRLLAVLALVAVGLGGTAAAVVAGVVHRAELVPAVGNDGLLTLLVIGSDIGPPHRPGNPLRGRADGIHLVAVDPVGKRATVVDFPRDGLVGGNKVNAHLATGGPERLKAQIEAFTGVTVDHWILGTFRSIENLVDGLDGVDVEIAQRMADPFSGSDFQPGPQRIRGWQALAFVRDRKSFGAGDVQRSANHTLLMRYAHGQIRREHHEIGDLVRLVGLLARNSVSDIPTGQLLPLALLAVQIPEDAIRQITLSGALGMTGGGASVIRLATGDTFERIRAGTVGP